MRYFVILLISALCLMACEKDETLTVDSSSQNMDNTVDLAPGGISMTCKGSCDNEDGSEPGGCQLQGNTGAPVVSCSCSGCKMRITFNDREVTDDAGTKKLVASNAEFINMTMRKLSSKYENQSVGIQELALEQVGEVSVVTYTIEVDGENPTTIMYVKNGNQETSIGYQKANTDAGKTYEIDCTGTCGCKEEYNFSTNTASCSCSECKMSVTEVDAEKN